MIKTDTSIGQVPTLTDSLNRSGSKAAESNRRVSRGDVVEISEECKKRLIMSNLKAALTATGAVKGRYNR
jgi:hypothetical protein